MKTIKYIKGICIMLATTAALVLTSCTNDDAEDPSRLFRPVNIELQTNENTVTATWAGIAGAQCYKVELYENTRVPGDDGENHDTKVLVAVDENHMETNWTVTDLKFETTYYFRVKAVSANPEYDSRFTTFMSYASIRTAAEAIVVSVEPDPETEGVFIVKWEDGFNLTYLVLTDAEGNETQITVNDADGEYILTGLNPGDYTIRGYNAERGFNTFAFKVPVLKDVLDGENTIENVTFRWVTMPGLSHIEVVNAANPAESYRFDIAGNTNNEYVATVGDGGLNYSTLYNATIYYSDGTAANEVQFQTVRQPNPNTVLVTTVEELTAAIAAATDGTTIALAAGHYEVLGSDGLLGNLQITTGITFESASAEMPVLECKGMQLAPTANVELVRLDNIHWYAGDFDPDATPLVYPAGTYMFDFQSGAAVGKVARLEIVNCRVDNLENSVLRNDRDATKDVGVESIIIDNCEMYNMNAKQCIIAYNVPFDVKEVTVTNSTFTNVGRMTTNTRFISLAGNPAMVFTFTNNTVTTWSATNNFIDYRYTTSGANNGRVVIQNNIFYNMNDESTTTYTKTPNFGTTLETSISGNNVYRPFGAVVGGVFEADNWSSYGSTNNDPQYDDPTGLTHDLTPKNQDIVRAGQGDPRWLD